MLFQILAALLCAQEIAAVPAPQRRSSNLKTVDADHVLHMKRTGKKQASSRALLLETADDIAPLKSVEGTSYSVEIELSGDKYDVIFDTGSSDLWVFHEGFQCLNAQGTPVPTARCEIGPEYVGDYDDGTVDNQHFLISYASGEILAGSLGYEDVTVGGITVNDQEMSLIEVGYWNGDGDTSGIIGFANSSITSSFPGAYNPNTVGTTESPKNVIGYTNWIDNAIDQNKFDPVFSVVLERGDNGGSGTLALGGLPDIDVDGDYVTVPLEDFEIQETVKFSYYTVIPDGLVIDGESVATNFPGIVDTGTTLFYVPNTYAEAINNAFEPKSKYVQSAGLYVNDCNATPPKVAVTIGGKDFVINSAEVLLQDSTDSPGVCLTGFQSMGLDYAIMGDVFLRNVVAVFDVGKEEMQFAAHTY